jgi:hypothetical protein
MDLNSIYGASFVNWETVSASWSKRTVSSRLLLFAARHFLAAHDAPPDPGRALPAEYRLPEEIRNAYAAPPPPDHPAALPWGSFVDAAVAAELETISYGERPPLLHELRAGLLAAADEAGPGTPLGRWFTTRYDALPGADLPDDPAYVPV